MTSGISDFRVPRKHGTPPCDFCGEDFDDGEDAYRLAKGKVHFSVPSFVPETASIFFHEECWRKVALERKKGEVKQPRPRQSNRSSPSRKHSSVAVKPIT